MTDRTSNGLRTATAFLVNARGRPTVHFYHGTEIVPASELALEDPAGNRRHVSNDGVALLFRCSETGLVRRWGLESLVHHGFGGDD